MNPCKPFTVSLILTLLVSSCSSLNPNYNQEQAPVESYLTSDKIDPPENSPELALVGNEKSIDGNSGGELAYIPSMTSQDANVTKAVDLAAQFNDKKAMQISADDLPLKDYLHYVMGEQLKTSYILGEEVKKDRNPVTLNLQQDISERKLFTISEELLLERGYVVRFDDGIYYIHKSEGNTQQGNIAYGYGKSIESVPQTSVNIIQFVPFTFGMQTSLPNTLKQILKINAKADFDRNAIIIQGKRKEIIRALEFVILMDQPGFKNRHIGVYKGEYVSSEDLIENLPLLLKQEGISVDSNGLTDKAVSIVPLERIGSVVLFANSKVVLDRVEFWAKQIDQPPRGNQLQYFMYQPRFSRAMDLGESIKGLLGGGSKTEASSRTSAAEQNKSDVSGKSSNVSTTASDGDTKLVVDGRANALIFNTTGDKYRQLLPLIKRLDVTPKQVLLEVMIAEVKLTDSFKQGVEFALTNAGAVTASTEFTLSGGATGLSYLLTGKNGTLSYNLLQTDTNVNVLSRPSLLVRDGVSASINVGEEIPTVGEIVSDPNNGNRTSVIYRKTGVDLKVTPTVNARGVVIMEIEQKITNQVPSSDSVAGSPVFFERSISTEVIADSGQTIILGGIISETRTLNGRSVPFFSDIPVIGGLFDSTSDDGDKTELIVMVTPKTIEATDEWDDIKAKFTKNLQNLKID